VAKVVVQPDGLGVPSFPYAHAVRCGDWVFCSGQSAADLVSGLAPDAAVSAEAASFARPVKRQIDVLYPKMAHVLAEAGSSIESVPKVVALFKRREDVDPYNESRADYQKMKPTSAAFPVSGLLAPDALIEIDPLAVVENDESQLKSFDLPDVPVHPDAGYSKGIEFGDWVFTVGATASDHVPRDPFGASSVAPQARVDSNYWLGSAVKRQARYVLNEKLIPLLEAAGCGLTDVVRAQVYLSNVARDYGAFLEVWKELFGSQMPSTVVMPVNGMGVVHCVVEISFIALRPNRMPVEVIEAEEASSWRGSAPAAIRAGDLVWCSTVASVDDRGLLPEARDDDALPYFDAAGKRQMASMMKQLSVTLAASGSDLGNLAKLTVFTADLRQLPGYIEVWRSTLADSPCAFTIVEVSTPFFTPTCTVAMDAIAIAAR
jgi:enamine deaminase RidA (YjgF/YER057c/UK114 family)